jgi:hypothetical protein
MNLELIPLDDDDAPSGAPDFKCKDCGSLNDCHTQQTWTDCGYEYDLICNKCGSDNVLEV